MLEQEAQSTPMGVREIDKENYSERSVKQIGETPFIEVVEGGKRFIALGQYRLTEGESRAAVDKLIKRLTKEDWKFMIAVIGAITDQTIKTYKGELEDGRRNGISGKEA